MSSAAGFSLTVPPRRRESLRDALDTYGHFAEAVPDFQHSRVRPLICFISFENAAVTHIARAHRATRAATGMRRLNIGDVIELPTPVRHSAIVEHVPARQRRWIHDRLHYGGFLRPASFISVVEALRDLSPASRPVLDRYSVERREMLERLPRETRRSLALQKETVATALALSGIDKKALEGWEPAPTSPSSFVDGLPAAVAREDAVVMADMMTIPGFELVASRPYGAALFRNQRVRLSVVLANHLPLEEQIGADLIYFNETYRSFVIVQYKMMERGNSGAFFALPNAQLSREIQRMDATLSHLEETIDDVEPDGYRLIDNPFFLKFCPRLIFDPDTVALSHGMYLPLPLWKRLEHSQKLAGQRGGRRLTYGNVGRYFDNTNFVNLMSGGWIGTSINASSVLREVIRNVLQTGRPLTFAVKTQTISDSLGAEDDDDSGDDASLAL